MLYAIFDTRKRHGFIPVLATASWLHQHLPPHWDYEPLARYLQLHHY